MHDSFWHITHIPHQDLEGRTHRPKTSRATYRRATHGTLLRFAAFSLVFVLAATTVTTVAGASIFSRFATNTADDVAVYTSEAAIAVPENSQTMSLLQSARNVDPNLSRGGGGPVVVDGVALVAEESPFVGTVSDTAKPASQDQISWYVVQEGDALSQVATLFGVSVNTIVWANELSSTKDIHPGQTLLILPISGIQHTIAKGETVGALAKKYGGDVDEILAYNNLADESALTSGMVITIPGGEVPEVKVAAAKTGTSGGTITTTASPASAGYYINPLPGAVRTQGIHGYNAVDLSDGRNGTTPVLAAASGKVIVSRSGAWNGGYGNYVVIDHPNGTQTLYGHLAKNLVWQGQSVVQGQVIGYEGNTGRSTGAHLHFEVRGAKNPF